MKALSLKKLYNEKFLTQRLGVWCQNEHGKSWTIKKLDAIPIIMALFENDPTSKTITLSEFQTRFFSPLAERQIIIYYNDRMPSALLTWSLMSDVDSKFYNQKNERVPEEWNSGDNLWFIDFIHTFNNRVPKWVFRHIKTKLFPDHMKAFSKTYMQSGELKRNSFKLWRNDFALKINKTIIKQRTSNRSQAIKYNLIHPFRDFDLSKGLFENASEKLLNKHKITANCRILICGAEANEFAMKIADTYQCKVILFDKNAWKLTQSAEIAVATKNQLEEPEFSILHGELGKIPIEDNSIDHVVSFGAMSRSPSPEIMFYELMRVTKQDSTVSLVEMKVDADQDMDCLLEKTGISTPQNNSQILSLIQPYTKSEITLPVIQDNHWAQPLKDWFHKEKIIKGETEINQSECNVESYITTFKRNSKSVDSNNLSYKKEKLTTLVTLSGGVDSTYLLWKLLNETDDEIIALHVNIANNEGRSEIENIRTEQIVMYLSEKIRPFIYETTGMDHRGLNWYGYDMMTIGFEVGIVATSHLLRTNHAVDRWTIASCSEEGRWPQRGIHSKACAIATCYPHKAPPYFAFPTISKVEQMRLMPRELLDLTWYCRRPVITRSGYKTCGYCKTCLLVSELEDQQ